MVQRPPRVPLTLVTRYVAAVLSRPDQLDTVPGLIARTRAKLASSQVAGDQHLHQQHQHHMHHKNQHTLLHQHRPGDA